MNSFRLNKQIENRKKGLTLIEVLVSVAVLAIIAGLFTQVIYGALESWRYNNDKDKLLHDGQSAMEMMVNSIRNTKWVLIPIKNNNLRDILAVSAGIDNDGDGLIDEDPGADITNDGQPGIAGIDDDGDGSVDEGDMTDDDEMYAGFLKDQSSLASVFFSFITPDEVYAGGTTLPAPDPVDEDCLNWTDSDLDGAYDEDPSGDLYGQGYNDDDNDGTEDEDWFDPRIFYLKGNTLVVEEHIVDGATKTLTITSENIAEDVTKFEVTRHRINNNTLIKIHLKLDNGKESAVFETTTLASNLMLPRGNCVDSSGTSTGH
ncbi:MAG: type II secretion system protein J [Nitrospinota bacterium]